MITTEVWFVVTTREGVIIKREYMEVPGALLFYFLIWVVFMDVNLLKLSYFFVLSITLNNQKD